MIMLVLAIALGESAIPWSVVTPKDGSPSVVVAPLKTGGDTSPVAIERIERAFVRGFEGSDVAVVRPESAKSCADAACLAGLARGGSGHAVQLEVTQRGRDYTLDIALVDADGRVSKASATCSICGFDEVAELAATQAATLAARIVDSEAPALLHVVTRPAGALVVVDGAAFGNTPVREQLSAGPHRVRVELDGYGSLERSVVAVAGVEEQLDLALARLDKGPNLRAMRASGGVLVGVGVAALGTGVTLLALHHRAPPGRCTSEQIDDAGECRWRYDTVTGGAIGLGIGVASVATGVALLVIANKRGRGSRRAARVRPTSSGLAVAF